MTDKKMEKQTETDQDRGPGAEPFQVSTKRADEKKAGLEGEATPRLPNEHDESADSQESGPRPDMQQAFDDVTSGQVDTDCRNQPGVEKTVDSGSDKQAESCDKANDATRSRHDRKP